MAEINIFRPLGILNPSQEPRNLKTREGLALPGGNTESQLEVGGTRQIPVNVLGEKEPW